MKILKISTITALLTTLSTAQKEALLIGVSDNQDETVVLSDGHSNNFYIVEIILYFHLHKIVRSL